MQTDTTPTKTIPVINKIQGYSFYSLLGAITIFASTESCPVQISIIMTWVTWILFIFYLIFQIGTINNMYTKKWSKFKTTSGKFFNTKYGFSLMVIYMLSLVAANWFLVPLGYIIIYILVGLLYNEHEDKLGQPDEETTA